MNILETLRKVITELDQISVPINLIEQIGVPVLNSSSQLKGLYNQIFNEATQKAEVAEEEEKEETPNEDE